MSNSEYNTLMTGYLSQNKSICFFIEIWTGHTAGHTNRWEGVNSNSDSAKFDS